MRWPDSLFSRLLLVQVLTLAGALLIFGMLLVIERNVILAPRYAALWEPALRRVLAQPVGAPAVPAYDLSGGLRRAAEAPSWLGPISPATSKAFRKALAPRGIQIDHTGFTVESAGVIGWAAVRLDGGSLNWVRIEGYKGLPGWSPRITVGVLLTVVLMAAVSRLFVRRVTRPLAKLHKRMLHHARTGQVLAAAPAGRQPSAPPELQAMDQAYSQLADQLQRNERERALLLAGVSHDLRSPLARIRLAAEMLPETPDNADGVAAVTRNVDVADRLIASFLEFVRTGTHPLNETVDATAVVGQTVAAMDRRPGELMTHLPERLQLHRASALLLERLVVNLVDNAIKHGGLPVQVRLATTNEGIELAVIDSGPGLPPGTGDTLLEAFARGDASRGVPGFGLGLAIVQQIVTRLQGQLRFERSPAGHAVKVLIPLRR